MIKLLKRKPTWKHNKHNIIMTYLYRLLEFYNIAHGGIYNHIHTYIYQTSSKHVWKHIPRHIPKYHTKTTSSQPKNKEGYIAGIWSAIYHVASSGPKCFHCTLTCSIAQLWNKRTFFCNIHWGSDWNCPFVSTCNTNQSITWSTSLTYFLSNCTWKTSWNFTVRGSVS